MRLCSVYASEWNYNSFWQLIWFYAFLLVMSPIWWLCYVNSLGIFVPFIFMMCLVDVVCTFERLKLNGLILTDFSEEAGPPEDSLSHVHHFNSVHCLQNTGNKCFFTVLQMPPCISLFSALTHTCLFSVPELPLGDNFHFHPWGSLIYMCYPQPIALCPDLLVSDDWLFMTGP